MNSFDWDDGNRRKNADKHNVTEAECEEIFFDTRNKQMVDTLHSDVEARYIIIGETRQHRLLYVVYTIRDSRIRIISARDLNRKERRYYE